MNTAYGCGHDRGRWDDVGRAAEHFAYRVARDARRFAARLEAHLAGFADEVRHDWRARHRDDRPDGAPLGDDLRRVFEDVRTVLGNVLDGVEEFLGRAGTSPWARVVANRDVACKACGKTTMAGAEAWARRTPAGTEFRCLSCGVPTEGQA
jgi:hypothetical protein